MSRFRLFQVMVPFCLAVFVLPGAGWAGSRVTLRPDFKEFTRVEAGVAFQLSITRSDSCSVVVEIDRELEPCLRMKQSGDTVKFDLRGQPARSGPTATESPP